MKKEVIKDSIISIIANAIPIIVVQLFLLPGVAKLLNSDEYGLAVTIVSLISYIPINFGNVLNNIRLIYNNKYVEKGINGDFRILSISLSTIIFITVSIFAMYYGNTYSLYYIFIIVLISILYFLREYYLVYFRLELNYFNILMANVLQVIGYICGYFIFTLTLNWLYIYLFGQLFSLLFICYKKKFWKEPIRCTNLFKTIYKETILLLFAGLCTDMLKYADRMIMFPILGGNQVAIYYAASIISKLAAMVITPIAGVILSYLNRIKKQPKKAVILTLIICFLFSIIAFGITLSLAHFIINILYPQYIEGVMKLIPYTTLVIIPNTLITVLNPFLMKFSGMKYQLIINAITSMLYVFATIITLKYFTLIAFCICYTIVYFIKLSLMIFIYFRRTSLQAEAI